MSVARFIADQKTFWRVPVAMCCALLGVSVSWFYKWWPRARAGGPTTKRAKRRAEVDAAVKTAFDAARGLHGSPRLTADLRDAGWEISAKTVADSMRRQQLVARRIRRRNDPATVRRCGGEVAFEWVGGRSGRVHGTGRLLDWLS